MSHFIFGVVSGVRVPGKEALRKNIEVHWGTDAQQSVILEMLAAQGKPDDDETPFCLVSLGEDNADALVSPYRCEPSQIFANLDSALAWLDKERMGGSAELWVTEGYDDAFFMFEGSHEQLRVTIGNVLSASSDVPSMRLKLGSSN